MVRLPNSQQLPSCTIAQQSTCFDGDICTRDTCQNGYCFYVPIAGCSSTLQAIRERDVTFVYHTYSHAGQQTAQSTFYQLMKSIGVRKIGDQPIPFNIPINTHINIDSKHLLTCPLLKHFCIHYLTIQRTVAMQTDYRKSKVTILLPFRFVFFGNVFNQVIIRFVHTTTVC